MMARLGGISGAGEKQPIWEQNFKVELGGYDDVGSEMSEREMPWKASWWAVAMTILVLLIMLKLMQMAILFSSECSVCVCVCGCVCVCVCKPLHLNITSIPGFLISTLPGWRAVL